MKKYTERPRDSSDPATLCCLTQQIRVKAFGFRSCKRELWTHAGQGPAETKQVPRGGSKEISRLAAASCGWLALN